MWKQSDIFGFCSWLVNSRKISFSWVVKQSSDLKWFCARTQLKAAPHPATDHYSYIIMCASIVSNNSKLRPNFAPRYFRIVCVCYAILNFAQKCCPALLLLRRCLYLFDVHLAKALQTRTEKKISSKLKQEKNPFVSRTLLTRTSQSQRPKRRANDDDTESRKKE